jgi:hypothetical protein
MHTQDKKMILEFMAAMYPRPLDVDELFRQTGIGGTRMRRAMWDLVADGFVVVSCSPAWMGLPWCRPRLSAAGLAVGSRLASRDEGAARTMQRLERTALEHVARSSSATASPTKRATHVSSEGAVRPSGTRACVHHIGAVRLPSGPGPDGARHCP